MLYVSLPPGRLPLSRYSGNSQPGGDPWGRPRTLLEGLYISSGQGKPRDTSGGGRKFCLKRDIITKLDDNFLMRIKMHSCGVGILRKISINVQSMDRNI